MWYVNIRDYFTNDVQFFGGNVAYFIGGFWTAFKKDNRHI